MNMISAKCTLKKIRNSVNWKKIAKYAYILYLVLYVVVIFVARVMENQTIDRKALYNDKHELAGYSINGTFYEFKVRDMPEVRASLIKSLQQDCIDVLLKPWMKKENIDTIQNYKVDVKLFEVDKPLLEGVIYSQRYPSGVCVTHDNSNSTIYIDEEIYENQDLFIDVYIHEYIHAMSGGGNSFDCVVDGEKYTIIKEGYTDYLTDIVIEKAKLKEKYNMKEVFNSAYENAKSVAGVLDNLLIGEENYPWMRAVFFDGSECADNVMYIFYGETYAELNRLIIEDSNSEVIPKLLWRIESDFQ